MIDIDEIINQMLSSNSVEKLETLYCKLKEMSSEFYINGRMSSEYTKLIDTIFFVENEMPVQYICDVNITPKIINDINKDNVDNFSIEEVLDYLVNCTRKYLLADKAVINNFDCFDTTGKCYISSLYLKNKCQELNIKCEKIRIDPGYELQAELFDMPFFHHLNFVEIRNKKYLIDCTYKQFFTVNRSSLERLGVPGLIPPNVGTFMLLNDNRKLVSEVILKQGWIEATDANLKHYFDGFTLSFRNGLYYEKIGEIVYETDYTAKNYMNFLKTNDSQVRYEDRELLGQQMIPLKDHRLNFKRK